MNHPAHATTSVLVLRVSPAELEALRGTGPATQIYLQTRAWMTFEGRCACGHTRPLSSATLAWLAERHIRRGRGVQIIRPTYDDLHAALRTLVRHGLLHKAPGRRVDGTFDLQPEAMVFPLEVVSDGSGGSGHV